MRTHGVASPRLRWRGASGPRFRDPRFRCAAPGVTHSATSPRLLVVGFASPQVSLCCAQLHQGLLMVPPLRGWGMSTMNHAKRQVNRGLPSPIHNSADAYSWCRLAEAPVWGGLWPQVPLRFTWGYSWCHLAEVAGGRGFSLPRFRFAAPGVTHGATSPRLGQGGGLCPPGFASLHQGLLMVPPLRGWGQGGGLCPPGSAALHQGLLMVPPLRGCWW